MKKPALIGLLLATALLALLGVVGTVGQSNGPAMPTKQAQAIKDCDGCG
jgi:hypothetical protein